MEEEEIQRPIIQPRRLESSSANTVNSNGIYAHRYPRMDEGYYRRLGSFWNYPQNTMSMTKEELAWAGFISIGEGDRVKCEYCDLTLEDWNENDVAFNEHARMRPNCPFILPRTSTPVHQNMRYLYDRRVTFNNASLPWPHSTNSAPLPSELADAGFFYTGQSDRVRCFHCSLVLHSWEPAGMPWHAHARFSPSCAYLMVEKGIDWIRQYAGVDPFRRRQSNDTDVVTVTGNESPIQLESDGSEGSIAEALVSSIVSDDGILQDLTSALGTMSIDVGLSGRPAEVLNEVDDLPDDQLRHEFERARGEQRCKVCLVNRATVVFLPCLHLAACPTCTQQLSDCPICRHQAEQVLEIFIT